VIWVFFQASCPEATRMPHRRAITYMRHSSDDLVMPVKKGRKPGRIEAFPEGTKNRPFGRFKILKAASSREASSVERKPQG